ncbi:MAG: glycosyltransferase [Lachnospiraceae bacterium]|nr:glycosyltransferase [Lachnospiraceae bacterium]
MQEEREPLISVVVPAYQVEEYLESCITSVCGQEYSNIEILLVYKKSQDRTAELCGELAERDCRIHAMECSAGGVSASRNMALAAAKGEYIAFVDADDYVEKDYLRQLCQNMDKCDISICGFDRIRPDSAREELLGADRYYERDELLADILCSNVVGGYLWNKLFQGSVIREQKLRFQEELSVGEDMCFIVSYVKQIQKGRYCNRILYHYRINQHSALQKMYTTGVFDKGKLSNMQAAQRIAELLADAGPEVEKAVSYRIVRTDMWTLFNLLKCRYYDKELLKLLQKSIRERRREYCRNDNARIVEKISCTLFSICPILFWKTAVLLLKLLPQWIIRRYVYC